MIGLLIITTNVLTNVIQIEVFDKDVDKF